MCTMEHDVYLCSPKWETHSGKASFLVRGHLCVTRQWHRKRVSGAEETRLMPSPCSWPWLIQCEA